MKFFALALAAASTASSLVILDKIDLALESVAEKTHSIVEHISDEVHAVQSQWYHHALTTNGDSTAEDSDASQTFYNLPEEQHPFFNSDVSHASFDHEDASTNSDHGHHGHGPDHGDRPPHPPGHGGDRQPPSKHRNPHDQKNKSIYEFLAESEYFTILHDIIKGDKHAVAELNKTSANLTLFAPTDSALKKYKDHAPPIEELRKILLYHLVPELYPAGRVLKSKTIPTLYEEKGIDAKQRLAVDINLRGLTLNYYARIIYIDIFTNNGVVHAIDNLLFPPPEIYNIAEVLPSTFSTFINAAWKTGLVDAVNSTGPMTIFAPSNFGFSKLGPRINAYLFSKRGQPTLAKLLKYHIVPDVLFYTDVEKLHGHPKEEDLVRHYELKTVLGEKISVDVGEYGRFRRVVINGRPMSVSDIPAKNGVLQKLDNVILPYKKGVTLENVQSMSISEFEAIFD